MLLKDRCLLDNIAFFTLLKASKLHKLPHTLSGENLKDALIPNHIHITLK